ncbi:MAG TPA: DUF177 domain-containing protein [Armatimonadota bacterium]|nr:DUF177 domain-containing protein [Armatimonadota bacterium]
MKIDLREIARTPGAHATHDFEEPLARDADVELAEPARGSFSVTNTGRLLVLRGCMTATVNLQCSRCCGPLVMTVEIPLSEEFSIGDAAGAAPEPTVDVEEPERAAFHDAILDLTELVRQHIIVNLPLRPLCREDCPGICPRCGNDLNAGACGCPAGSPPGPLWDLKRLLEPGPEGG